MSDEEDILSHANRRIGSVLHGKYRLDAVLGIGGMAVVYAATHRNQKQFAIKLLHPEFSVRSDFRARFLREGYAANSVRHEGVVSVLDDDVDETGTAFLVMDLLRGADVELLRERSNGRLPLQMALALGHQVLDVLAAAHERGIIHRDLKPANLFVVESGQVKVLDFGIARSSEGASSIHNTPSGSLLGTPAFMAPEQASAHHREVDAQSDLWALGACLFTLISGQFVHQADSSTETLIQAATTPARSVSGAAPDVPASVVELIDRALRFEKSARWPSALAMRKALEQVHRELFGELSREPLRTCVAELGAARYGVTPAAETRALADGDTIAATPEPVPAAAPQSTKHRRRSRSWLVGLVAAAVLGAPWLGQLVHAPNPLLVTAPLGKTLTATRSVIPVLASQVASSAASAAPPLLTPETAARGAQVAPKGPRSKRAFNSNRISKPPATAVAPPPSEAVALTRIAASNPLELELQ